MEEMGNLHYVTGDGSSTLFSEKYGETYHSRHGAIQESMHVFIEMGLAALPPDKKEISILEMGLGTGLNALLTALHQGERRFRYTSLEAEPVDATKWQELNYSELLAGEGNSALLQSIHQLPWNSWHSLQADFQLFKFHGKLQDFQPESAQRFDLIYYDAFAPGTQPELWTQEIFEKLFAFCYPGALLTTYCAKGDVRRAMMAAGFAVERLPGPPGKREMLRGSKPYKLSISSSTA